MPGHFEKVFQAILTHHFKENSCAKKVWFHFRLILGFFSQKVVPLPYLAEKVIHRCLKK